MADTVLLVSEQRMKQWTSLDNNIRIDVLNTIYSAMHKTFISKTL